MRACDNCNRNLPEYKFINKSDNCVLCSDQVKTKYELDDKNMIISKSGADRKNHYIKTHGDCCQLCNISYPVECYDFHHTDPTTKDQNMGVNYWAWDYSKALKEANKCVILCANCHRSEHAALRKGYSLLDNNLDKETNTDQSWVNGLSFS